jgi:hypothetical protein
VAIVAVVENPSPLERQLVLFLQRMTQQNKAFALAMLVPSEAALSDKWNLVLSALWIDQSGLRAVIPTITSALQKQLSRVNLRKLERVSVVETTAPLVTAMADFRIPLGRVSRVQYFPQAENAMVLVAEPPNTARTYQPQPVHTRA